MTSAEFRTQVLQLFYHDIHRLEQNNYSHRRFSYDGIDRSTQFDVGKHVMFMNWFIESYEEVFKAWSRLSDRASRDLYIDLLRYRLAGHLHVKIRTAMHDLQVEAQKCQDSLSASPSSMALSGLFGQLVHYEGTWRGHHYAADTISDGMLPSLVFNQYYFDREGVSIQPVPGDHVIDAGAFAGEVAIVFSQASDHRGAFMLLIR